ncbi:hypothetical protein JHK87_040340 [Glycine soja]|nr:hypothetical protein JHK87_040340 [Glycine soja]
MYFAQSESGIASNRWFCFVCIDDWATITNLCPLCQNEFQLITCVPVYDTIGNNKVEDDSFFRDNDWSIEEKNNTTVICLDGDGCKVRNGLATIEGDSDLDTSIACDSCDIWYHAFCVGFDSEVDSADKNETKDQATDVLCLSSEECFLKGDEIEANACKYNARVAGGKRKHVDYSDEQVYIKDDDRDVKPELPEEDDKPELSDEIGQKKIRATGSQMTSTNDSADAHLLENA